MVTISGGLSSVVQWPKFASGRKEELPAWVAWTISEASEKTGYNPQYIRRLAREKKIEAKKFGPYFLIRADSLRQYLKEAQEAGDGRYTPRKKPKQEQQE